MSIVIVTSAAQGAETLMKRIQVLLLNLTGMILIILMGAGVYFTLQKDTADPRTETCRIMEVKGNIKGGNSILRTHECGSFQVDPSLLSGLYKGSTYELKVSGLEVPVIAWYPTVHELTLVEDLPDPFAENVSPFPEQTYEEESP